MVNIVISGRIPSKKNQKQIVYVRGRPLIVESKRHREWYKAAMLEMDATKKAYDGVNGQLPIPCSRLTFTLFAPDARKGDLSNKFESVADLLVGAGVLEDDNWCVMPQVLMQYGGIDRQNPRAEVLIS